MCYVENEDNYYGGGFSEVKKATKVTCEKEVSIIIKKFNPLLDELAYVLNNNDCDESGAYEEGFKLIEELECTLGKLKGVCSKFYELQLPED